MSADPIHYAFEAHEQEHLLNDANWVFEPGWFFWTETWADRVGPYASYDEARHMLERYVSEVLG